jgi:hypothetical protein
MHNQENGYVAQMYIEGRFNNGISTEESIKRNFNIVLNMLLGMATCFRFLQAKTCSHPQQRI